MPGVSRPACVSADPDSAASAKPKNLQPMWLSFKVGWRFATFISSGLARASVGRSSRCRERMAQVSFSLTNAACSAPDVAGRPFSYGLARYV